MGGVHTLTVAGLGSGAGTILRSQVPPPFPPPPPPSSLPSLAGRTRWISKLDVEDLVYRDCLPAR